VDPRVLTKLRQSQKQKALEGIEEAPF
jgi:hypothetical protein